MSRNQRLFRAPSTNSNPTNTIQFLFDISRDVNCERTLSATSARLTKAKIGKNDTGTAAK